ncbi:MAG TPA: ATP-dependent RNA helicase DbpA [Legionellales bacterium]|nr:ATP-dependent RNA helicase DbpA [Legionellales bacterium]
MKEELSFSSLPLRPELLNNLLSLNYHQMTPIQAQSLPLMLMNHDIIAQAQTGSGKTVAFGLAALQNLKIDCLQPQTLIICPTRELAEQVSQVLRSLARRLPNIKILNLSGGLAFRPQSDSLRHGAHVIVGTPGRILKHLDKKTLLLSNVSTVVLDEADRMLDMGFIDAMKQVLRYCPSKRQTLLFSATFTPPIKQLAKEFMKEPQEITVEEEKTVQDIEQKFLEVEHPSDKYNRLKKILVHYNPSATLIFCNTKEKTQELSSQLNQDGFSATVLNGDLEQAERDQAIIQFSNHSRRILVATDVAARGLDIKELPAVINFDLAFEPEVHVHRIGRTGRAGHKGLAISITTPKDAERLCALEDLMSQNLIWLSSDEFSTASSQKLPPKMVTLRLMAGRKDKIRAGDILGALTKDAGLESSAIGKIDILNLHAYVAIEQNFVKKAYTHFQNGKIKGKKVGVECLT